MEGGKERQHRLTCSALPCPEIPPEIPGQVKSPDLLKEKSYHFATAAHVSAHLAPPGPSGILSLFCVEESMFPATLGVES